MKLALLVVALVLSLVTAYATCPSPAVQPDFDYSRYFGTWYEVARLPFSRESDGHCIEAYYYVEPKFGPKVNNSMHYGSPDGPLKWATGSITKSDECPAKLMVKFSLFAPSAPYWVLSTDYVEYAFVYSCSTYFSTLKYEYAWVLARNRSMSQETITSKVEELSALINIDTSKFIRTPQQGCD